MKLDGPTYQFQEEAVGSFAKQTIAALLANAIVAFRTADKIVSIHDAERMGRVGHGYLSAANSVLYGHAWLHNELIESPDFMQARKLGRKWPQ